MALAGRGPKFIPGGLKVGLSWIIHSITGIISVLITSKGLQNESQVVLINIYCVAGYFDNVQNVIGGALRGVGINQAPAAVYLICGLAAAK